MAAFEDHLRLLLAWTEAVNLTAVKDPADAITLHILDSLAAVPLVRAAGADRLIDLGSGGGYPGLPLAIAVPCAALLVDSVGKKTRFLDTVVRALALEDRVAVATARAEVLAADPAHREQWPLATARAVASLGGLVELAFPLLVPGGRLIAWKRGDIETELVAGRRAVAAMGGGSLSVQPIEAPGLDGHLLVVARKRGATPRAYPREPALRRRRPW